MGVGSFLTQVVSCCSSGKEQQLTFIFIATLELSDHGRDKKQSQTKNPLCLSFVSPATVSKEDKPLSISLSITGNGVLLCISSCAYHVPSLPSFIISVHHYPYWSQLFHKGSKKQIVDVYQVLIRKNKEILQRKIFQCLKYVGIPKFSIKYVCLYLLSNGTKFHRLNESN